MFWLTALLLVAAIVSTGAMLLRGVRAGVVSVAPALVYYAFILAAFGFCLYLLLSEPR